MLDLTTQFDKNVLKQLRDRCKFLGIDQAFYKDAGVWASAHIVDANLSLIQTEKNLKRHVLIRFIL